MQFGKYNILTTKEQISQLDRYLTEGNFERLSVDTETNGLFFWKNLVIGISISTDSKSGFYIPFLTWEPDLASKKIRKIDKLATEVFERGRFRCVWTDRIFPEDVNNSQYQYPDFIVSVLKKHLLDAKPQLIMHNAPFDVLMIDFSLGLNLEENVFCDTVLLKHVIDENTSMGLKETAILWAKELGIPVEQEANREQKEMGTTVIRNGGTYNMRTKHIWRADLDVMGKYAVADTFLTFGLFEVGVEKLITEYEPRHLDWFFEDEVMPLCREVIIPMRRNGVHIDVTYFKEMEQETASKMMELEDNIVDQVSDLIKDFSIGSSVDEIATKKAIVEQLIKEMNLEYPTITQKGIVKKSLAKKALEVAFDKSGHWLWGYLLGENELQVSGSDLKRLKQRIYEVKTGKRNQFNISSDAHLRWLFCKKLGYAQESLPQTDSATPQNPIASMKAEVLKTYFAKNHEFVKPLLLYKKLQKLHSTYILPAIELNNNGYLHMDFIQSGTVSGRFACRGGFNLQTLPRAEEIERCVKCGSKDVIVVHPIKLVAVQACNACDHIEEDILCPSAIKAGFTVPEGYKIINADYSSLEPRCFAFMSGDQKIKDVYLKNLDFYSKLYCDMEDSEGKYSPDPKAPNFLKKVRNDLRTMVKPVALGIPYGARGPQTAKLMGFKKTIEDRKRGGTIEVIDVERGNEFRDKYLATYPDLKRYMDQQDANACGNGFVETIVGRRRHFKFTKPVYKLISMAGLTIDEFLDVPRKKLENQDIDDEFLTLTNLKMLAKECGFGMVDEKGIGRTWAFVRAMFKNELNNSKNCPIQGLGAHIANKAMLESMRAFKAKGLDALVVLQVHDEITTYGRIDQAEAVVKTLQDCMENNSYAKLVDIPMIAEPIIANNLKEAK